jgi:divalent metal cation (Fe/Co/Zn/Cd) transporter
VPSAAVKPRTRISEPHGLAILTITALAQAFIYSRTLSVALLADLIHDFGGALTAIPLGLAFFFRSLRGERLAGLGVVLAIFISAMVALVQTIERFIHPRRLSHLWLHHLHEVPRSVRGPAEVEAHDANYVGGDI